VAKGKKKGRTTNERIRTWKLKRMGKKVRVSNTRPDEAVPASTELSERRGGYTFEKLQVVQRDALGEREKMPWEMG